MGADNEAAESEKVRNKRAVPAKRALPPVPSTESCLHLGDFPESPWYYALPPLLLLLYAQTCLNLVAAGYWFVTRISVRSVTVITLFVTRLAIPRRSSLELKQATFREEGMHLAKHPRGMSSLLEQRKQLRHRCPPSQLPQTKRT